MVQLRLVDQADQAGRVAREAQADRVMDTQTSLAGDLTKRSLPWAGQGLKLLNPQGVKTRLCLESST